MTDKKLVTLEEYDKLVRETGLDLRVDVANGSYQQRTITEGEDGLKVETYRFISRADVAGKMLMLLYEQKLAGQEGGDV